MAGLGLGSGTAFAHSKFVSPAPRSDEVRTGAPCGGVERTDDPTPFEAGEEITVEWYVQADHGGSYAIGFSKADDEDFEVLVDGLPDDMGSGPRTATVVLPDVACTDCTLQLVQVNDAGYATYHSCADIELVGEGGCSIGRTSPASSWWLLMGLAGIAAWRRRPA